MAIREVTIEQRFCELTDEPDAKIVPITVGPFTWHVDLSTNGLKLLLKELHPITSKGTLISAGGDEDALDEDEPETDQPDPDPSPADGPADDASTATLTDEERPAARAWGERNWRRIGLKRKPGPMGPIPLAVKQDWIDAGRPPM